MDIARVVWERVSDYALKGYSSNSLKHAITRLPACTERTVVLKALRKVGERNSNENDFEERSTAMSWYGEETWDGKENYDKWSEGTKWDEGSRGGRGGDDGYDYKQSDSWDHDRGHGKGYGKGGKSRGWSWSHDGSKGQSGGAGSGKGWGKVSISGYERGFEAAKSEYEQQSVKNEAEKKKLKKKLKKERARSRSRAGSRAPSRAPSISSSDSDSDSAKREKHDSRSRRSSEPSSAATATPDDGTHAELKAMREMIANLAKKSDSNGLLPKDPNADPKEKTDKPKADEISPADEDDDAKKNKDKKVTGAQKDLIEEHFADTGSTWEDAREYLDGRPKSALVKIIRTTKEMTDSAVRVKSHPDVVSEALEILKGVAKGDIKVKNGKEAKKEEKKAKKTAKKEKRK